MNKLTASQTVSNWFSAAERSLLNYLISAYENIYLVVQGSKHFYLLPPIEFHNLHGSPTELACDKR